jgi:hypothetical protein
LGTFPGARLGKECSTNSVDRSLSEFTSLKTLELNSEMLLGYEEEIYLHEGPTWYADERSAPLL